MLNRELNEEDENKVEGGRSIYIQGDEEDEVLAQGKSSMRKQANLA